MSMLPTKQTTDTVRAVIDPNEAQYSINQSALMSSYTTTMRKILKWYRQ